MADLERDLAPVPVLRAALAAEEVRGIELLRAFASGLYRTKDPTAVLHEGASMRFDIDGDRAGMSLHIPLVERSSIDLRRSTDELIVTVGQYRRVVALPDSLRHRDVASARFRGEHLDVEFASVGSGRSSRS